MARGRPRKAPRNLPQHIDYSRVPAGLYWDPSGTGRWYVRDDNPEGGTKVTSVAGPAAKLSDLHAIAEARRGDTARGTVDWLSEQFQGSTEFKKLATGTQRDYKWCASVLKARPFGQLLAGKVPLPLVQRLVEDIAAGRAESRKGAGDAIEPRPAKANHVLRYLRRLYSWGARMGHVTHNPGRGVRQAEELGEFKMPDPAVFAAVLRFAQERGQRKAHSKGSVSPTLHPAMEIAYAARLRGIEVTTLTDAHALEGGLQSNRRKGSLDNVTRWNPRLRAAWDAAVAVRKSAIERTGRPIPLLASQRFLFVAGDGAPMTKSGFDSNWQRLMKLAIAEKIITEEQRFTLHGIKHRGITDTAGTRAAKKDASGHRTDAAFDRYDHEMQVVEPATHADFSGDFSGGNKKGTLSDA